MDIKLLKPKSPKQALKEFASIHNISAHELTKFVKGYSRDKRNLILFLSIIMWMFSISMIICGVKALKHDYFWYPIYLNKPSMLDFVNMCWIVTWFAIPTFLIIYGIIILLRSYDYNE
jgi:hypothetical protein